LTKINNKAGMHHRTDNKLYIRIMWKLWLQSLRAG